MKAVCLTLALISLCLITPAGAVEVFPNTLSISPAVVHPGDTLTLTLEGAPKHAFVMLIMGPNTGSLDMLYFTLGVVPPFMITSIANTQPDGSRVAHMAVPSYPPAVVGQAYYMQTVAPQLQFSMELGFSVNFFVSNVATFSFGQ